MSLLLNAEFRKAVDYVHTMSESVESDLNLGDDPEGLNMRFSPVPHDLDIVAVANHVRRILMLNHILFDKNKRTLTIDTDVVV